MRDDIQQLLTEYLELNRGKHSLLERMLQSCREKRHLVRTDSIDALPDLDAEDAAAASTIDTIDADLAAIRKKICDACGIDYGGFASPLTGDGHPIGSDLADTDKFMADTMRELRDENEKLVNELEKAMERTAKEIESMERVISLKDRIRGKGDHP